MRKVALFILLLIPLQAKAELSRAVLYAGTAFDVASTEMVLHNGGRELNPVLGQNHYRRISTTIGLTLATDLSARWLIHNNHPKIGKWMNLVSGSVHISAGIHNMRNR